LYRINTIHIEIPPLRERAEDIDALAAHFLHKYAGKYNREKLSISPQVIVKMKDYHWPGNIRELEHTIEKAVIMSDGQRIKPDDVLFKPIKAKNPIKPVSIEDMEKQMILDALDKFDGNYSSAANELGITRQTLYNKIKKYGI
jgi:DNA-binding NtrC family response regulator